MKNTNGQNSRQMEEELFHKGQKLLLESKEQREREREREREFKATDHIQSNFLPFFSKIFLFMMEVSQTHIQREREYLKC